MISVVLSCDWNSYVGKHDQGYEGVVHGGY